MASRKSYRTCEYACKAVFAVVVAAIICLLLVLTPVSASAQSHGLAVGYGFGFLSNGKAVGHIEEGNYNFFNLAYRYERYLSQMWGLLVEPFVSYTERPEDGVDAGLTLSLKYKFSKKDGDGFFMTFGGGSAYTSVDFKEQGSHVLFILHTGIGYTWKKFFLETRFKHYSNGGIEHPNRSINAALIMAGVNF